MCKTPGARQDAPRAGNTTSASAPELAKSVSPTCTRGMCA
eukprot:CAMPEP_0183387920 /NCGR_PEP_ID=MMETSP0370-20130417/3675_1 /TAXON_ID=268820 /ORGANISM="Peridinium aciculiferum, Strain PAER-2" /LENGTH=39 /DNA_ID= /DNA_START= /DNA_END= /DNA_ORIENTATION=